MNLGLRAILYTVRKWKKTLLVFFLLLAITTLVLSGLCLLYTSPSPRDRG